MLLNFQDLDKSKRYKLISQTITPRPIGWVVTEDQVINIAPFSFYTPLSSDPPTLLLSIGHRPDGSPKDTLRNIETTKRCTICSVFPDAMEQMHLSSVPLAPGESESEHFQIPTKRLHSDYPPAIEGAASAFFCTFFTRIDLPGSSTIPIILSIEHGWYDDRYIDDTLSLSFRNLGRNGKYYQLPGQLIEAKPLPKA